jgi:putative heme-binding domain-containing protein
MSDPTASSPRYDTWLSMHKRFLATALLAGRFGFLLAALVIAQNPTSEAEPKPYTPHIAPAAKDGTEAIKRIRVPKELKVDLWAAEPVLANPVCLAIDGKNRIYVAETIRLQDGVTDIRGHMDWLDDDLACRSVADRVAMLKRREGDWIKNYAVHHERILLESIVLPNKQIAKGFETVVLTLTNGTSAAGVLKGEDAKEVRLMTAEGKLLVVPKSHIDERQTGKSAMPEDLVKHLSKSDLGDLVEFLAELKQK